LLNPRSCIAEFFHNEPKKDTFVLTNGTMD
jgi:hypothetical protein